MIKRLAWEQLCRIHRLHQHFPGRWRVSSWLETKRPVLKMLPGSPRKMAQHTYLFLDPEDRYDGLKYLIHGLNLREPISHLFCQLLRHDDCMLDIGANVGYFSALGSGLVGRHGAVHAFEASPEIFMKLKTLESRNRFKNVIIHNFAVSDIDGLVELHSGPPDHTGITSIRNLGESTYSTTKVPSIRIDELIDDIPKVRLVKIDIEGAEMLAINGMKRLIERDWPFVICELTDHSLRQLGSCKEEIVEYFKNRGYEAFRIGNLITNYIHKDEYQCDVLFVPPEEGPIEFDASL